MTTLRDQLRAIPSLVGSPPSDFPSSPPLHPRELIMAWLFEAVNQGVPEPHHITLSTLDEDGFPDARVLVIKDINADGSIEVAVSAHSPKGRQLARDPHVAVSWYCSAHTRAIRIKGFAERAEERVADNDWKARSISARAVVLSGQQSHAFEGTKEDRERLIKETERKIGGGSGGEVGNQDWTVWRVKPDSIEFWQGAKDRNHDRLKYIRQGESWTTTSLWP